MNRTQKGRAVDRDILLTDGWMRECECINSKEVTCCDVRRSIKTLVGFTDLTMTKLSITWLGEEHRFS